MRIAKAGSLLVSLALAEIAVATRSVATPVTAPQRDGVVETVFGQWLNTFNSGDPTKIKAFYASHLNNSNPAFALESAEDTCGLAVEKIVAKSATAMTVLLRQKCLPGLQRLKLELAEAGGSKLKTLELRPLPLPGDGAVSATVAIARRLASRDTFAGSLIIQHGAKRLVARSWGLADPVARTPMTLDTPMFLASAGKMFTSVAVLQLVDAGKIELDAPLGRYLPDTPMPRWPR